MIRCLYGYDKKSASRAVAIEFKDPSLAVQSQKDEADINNIVRNFGVTGKVPVSIRVPTYGDFDGVDDYQTALESIRLAESSFMALPSEVRKRFEHDPQRFVEFCSDSSNLEEMRKLGLAPEALVSDAVASPSPEKP
ncbi:internal scaffolding protein [Chifec microvirus UA13_14]|nr:internal scaffolding protein [Chifec microvirus UA13_14]